MLSRFRNGLNENQTMLCHDLARKVVTEKML